MEKYAEIMVDVANRRLDQCYHYVIPEKFEIKVGMTVLVTLKNRKVQGLVVGISNDFPELKNKEVNLKEIDAILEGQNLIPEELVQIACWLAETTICPIAQALHTVWPFLKGKVEPWVIPLAGMEEEDVKVLELLNPEIYRILNVLNRSRKKMLTEKVLLKRAEAKPEQLEEMIKQGWVRKESRFSRGQANSQKQKNRSQNFDRNQEIGIEPGFILSEDRIVLNAGQRQAVDSIWDTYLKREGATVLLHGITGSGKTEVYKEIVSRVLDEGGDVIILVPEISLTSQIAGVFLKRFMDKVGIIHSGISATEKITLWEDILAGEKKIIIGARSAVFAPLSNLKLIILDEEHDNAYKQDENPKYHARDVARYRMKQRNGLVILGSATPSLEAYAAAQRKNISCIYLGERYNQIALPSVEIVDMRLELANGNRSTFSFLLREKLRDRIEKGEQSILFLNRRGYSTFVFCRECGFVARCPQCDVALTYHSNKQELRCHYCDHQQEVFHHCPDCGSKYIRFFGLGTQKVEEEVSALFPGIEVLRLDTDTTSGQGKHEKILERFRTDRVPVMVGTQMLAKGLDFPNVTLVGVISADQLLNMPDFRSRERAFQLLTQVAGRAGRGTKQGDVVIQTYSPEDRSITMASQQDYPAFFWEEIAYRKKLGYPPFSHIIRILIYHEKEDRVILAAQELTDCLRRSMETTGSEYINKENIQILGPAPAVLTKLKNEFRWQVSIKGRNPDVLRKIVHAGVKLFYNGSACSGINISIEVNPLY